MSKFFTVIFLVVFSFSAFAQYSLVDYGSADVSGTTIVNPPMAPVVFLDQVPNQVNGLFADSNCLLCGTLQQSIADNFSVGVAGPSYAITEIVMWGGYYPENIPNTTDDFTIIVHSDAGGSPGAVVDSRSGLEATSRVTTGVVLFGVDEYMFTFDFSASPIMIANPGTYWIEIFNNSVESGNFFWETGNLDVTNGIVGSGWATETPGVSWNLDGATDLAVKLNGDDALPVELVSFTASVDKNDVTLNWLTATEINNQGFEIERNFGYGFQTIGYIAGFGTSSETHAYSFVDASLKEGKYTYRLKQIDLDGTFEYSNVVEVDVTAPDEFTLAQNYPNPFNPSTRIDFSLAVDSKVSLRVFDVLGQEVASLINSNLVAGSHNVVFNAAGLNSGVYFYRIDASGIDGTNFSSVKKMILTK